MYACTLYKSFDRNNVKNKLNVLAYEKSFSYTQEVNNAVDFTL